MVREEGGREEKGGKGGREGERARGRRGGGERKKEREQTSLQTGQGVFFLPHKSSCSLNWSIGND